MFTMCNAALTHVEIPRPHDATELNNDGMITLGDIHKQTEPNLSIFRKRFNQRWLQFLFAYSSAIDLHCHVIPLKSFC